MNTFENLRILLVNAVLAAIVSVTGLVVGGVVVVVMYKVLEEVL